MEHSFDVQRILRAHGVTLSEEHRELLCRFVDRVIDWNQKINLISRRDEDQIWFSHILHSLTPLLYVDLPRNISVLDLGTGGGFPGVPLAIVRPDLRITLLDSIRKKSVALGDILSGLDLRNTSVMTARAEEVGRDLARSHRYECVVARAVAPLGDLIRWSRPLVRRHDHVEPLPREARGVVAPRTPFLLAMKGGDLAEELQSARVKERASDLEVIDIVFRGSEEIGLEQKKLVIVPL